MAVFQDTQSVVKAGYTFSFRLDMHTFRNYHYQTTSAALQLRRQVLSDESDRLDRLSLSLFQQQQVHHNNDMAA
jgi:hypothetical protein